MAPTRSTFRLLIALAAATAGVGCQSPAQSGKASTNDPQPRLIYPLSNAHVFHTDAVRLATNTAPPERFEFARLDDDLTARSVVPLRATQQWPQPPRPLERRIYFRWWEQD